MKTLERTKFPLTVKDRTYVLLTDSIPLTYSIASRDSRTSRLMFEDEKTGEQRPLRYARNYPTPFVDEQDDDKVILEQVSFIDGSLSVPSGNKALQFFMHVHPLNGVVFKELDPEKEAKKEFEILEREIEALTIAKGLSIEQIEMFGRQLLGMDVSKYSTKEIHRDLLMYARDYPEAFLDLLEDPELQVKDVAVKAIQEGYLQFRNNGRDIYYNLPDNKKKLMTIPLGEEGEEALAAYFLTKEGKELYKFLEQELR